MSSGREAGFCFYTPASTSPAVLPSFLPTPREDRQIRDPPGSQNIPSERQLSLASQSIRIPCAGCAFLPSTNPKGGCQPHSWVCKLTPGRAPPDGPPLPGTAPCSASAIPSLLPPAAPGTLTRAASTVQKEQKEKKREVDYALCFGAFWPRKAFLYCNISKRLWWHYLLTWLLMLAQVETAMRQKSHRLPGSSGQHLHTALPNPPHCQCSQDWSKHLHPFLTALQRRSSPGYSPNPKHTDG